MNQKLSALTTPQKLLLSLSVEFFCVVSTIAIVNLLLPIHLLFCLAVGLMLLGGILNILGKPGTEEESAGQNSGETRDHDGALIGAAFLLGYPLVMLTLLWSGCFEAGLSSSFLIALFVGTTLLSRFVRAAWE